MSDLTIREATTEEALAFSSGAGEGVTSVNAVAVVAGSDVVGVGGLVTYYRNSATAFSQVTPALRQHPRTIARVALMIRKMVEEHNTGPVYAIRDSEEHASGSLLERLGFHHLGYIDGYGEVYQHGAVH